MLVSGGQVLIDRERFHDGYVRLARLLSERLGGAKQADAVLDRMIAGNQNAAGAW